jgi:hypothetical protein
VSTQVHSCPLLSHSYWPQRSCRKNPCYNRRVKAMCANALSRSVPTRRDRIARFQRASLPPLPKLSAFLREVSALRPAPSPTPRRSSAFTRLRSFGAGGLSGYWNLAFAPYRCAFASWRPGVGSGPVQNGTFRDWDCTCHRHFLRKRTNFFGTSPILSNFAESVQNPYKSDHFREHQFSTPMTPTTLQL